MILYTIEAEERYNLFRLQRDGSWRARDRKDVVLQENDFSTRSVAVAAGRAEQFDRITLDGSDFPTKSPLGRSLADRIADVTSCALRDRFPETPTLAQLDAVIRTGDDSRTQSLVLTVDGQFELWELDDIDLSVNNPFIVCRHEAFGFGNEYKGNHAAANDTTFLEDIFAPSLASWVRHLESGQTQDFIDYNDSRSSEVLTQLSELARTWQPHFTVRYPESA